MFLDTSRFTQCRTCFTPMLGILGVKAREDCRACGGEALGVWGDRTKWEKKKSIGKVHEVAFKEGRK